MSKVTFFIILVTLALVASYPSPDPNPDDSPASLQSVIEKGTEASQLISLSTFNEIENQPVDYTKAKTSCTIPNEEHSIHNGITDPNARWYKLQDGRTAVLTHIRPDFTQEERDIVITAMNEIMQSTCIVFYVYNNPNDVNGWDWVDITRTSEGCFSTAIGRARQGRQQVNLQPTDSQGLTCMIKGIAVHELLHAMGFFHQQNTPGRNNYVRINWDNMIQTDNVRYQFQEISPSDRATEYGAPYDYGSIMHYDKYAFTRNGLETITTLNGAEIGQRDGISYWDVYKVNQMYQCQ